MNNTVPLIDGKKETERIASFLQRTFRLTGRTKVVIGWSGGIDSTVSLYLLAQALSPEHIFVMHLPYAQSHINDFEAIQKALHIPLSNIIERQIKHIVDTLKDDLMSDSKAEQVRLGNIMARMRMVIIFDRAKELDGLVCGTENRSEHLLGYYTRYGDGASDIEPIMHLYKTQVYMLARYLGIPDQILTKVPTAGLWEGQTDEKEFGFSYREADNVLYLYKDKKKTPEDIKRLGYANTDRIIKRLQQNTFKDRVPYTLK